MKRTSLICLLVVVLIMGSASAVMCETPVYGGVLRVITAAGPQALSYVPIMGPTDASAIFPGGERLVNTNIERQVAGGVVPVLAEKVIEDPENLKITWHIRKGVKFHDGSDLDAEVVRWSFMQIINANALPNRKYFKDIEVVDKYTLVTHLTEYSNQLVPNWGYWCLVTSKAA